MLVPKQKAFGLPCLLRKAQQMRQALEQGLSEKLWNRKSRSTDHCGVPDLVFWDKGPAEGKWLRGTLLPKIGCKEAKENIIWGPGWALWESFKASVMLSCCSWSTESLTPLTSHSEWQQGLWLACLLHLGAAACRKLTSLLPQPPECWLWGCVTTPGDGVFSSLLFILLFYFSIFRGMSAISLELPIIFNVSVREGGAWWRSSFLPVDSWESTFFWGPVCWQVVPATVDDPTPMQI